MAEASIAADGEAVRDLNSEADEIVAECGGNARDAVIALLARLHLVEHELALTKPVVSRGFSRGWHHRMH
jgi:hypothetical protein